MPNELKTYEKKWFLSLNLFGPPKRTTWAT